ncbi:helix-turn-helix domain-containing protein [Alicyclobacillus sp. SO9]|uniref:winged helix-turn-helix transcriptional regulator n=1 Tax=Alicyclobacillus sp. SO9 TaxID=2665646 RepID=UPI0018E74DA7|nr:helix-turn-helix domain-containing protein [Alicyclobacillus sp. SO9]QQE78323.1 helix-turn-helix transcriptional regulator [Alicyclobacillus sp. SO9]
MAESYTPTCPVEITLKIIGGRWKILIIRELFLKEVSRFNELQHSLPGITHKVLTHQLRVMEADGLIQRTVYAQVPPKVEYTLTSYGRSLKPILDSMHEWGENRAEPILDPIND